jgi:tRNA pseudouridine32 synthase/23S rRNA pseudouridine746 synthase
MKLVVHLDPPSLMEPLVVFEDDWLLVADKPAGMPSQATRGDSAGALDAWAQARLPDARLVHRLDRDASGLILISQCADARAPLAAALDGGRIERRYLALVAGRLDEGEIALRIARDSGDERRRQALPENDPSGQPARSRYRAVEKRGEDTLVELTLDTGRTHQLRVHLAAIGHPICGDTLYGGTPAERLMLHAHALQLRHPRNRRPLSFSAPAPFA